MANYGVDLHVVMLPWSAFGHMIPFYQLATALAKHGVRVSYISTPRNIDRLPKIPPELDTLVEYVTLPMPKIPNNGQLPQGAEATVDVEFDEIQYLKAAYDLLLDPFKQFMTRFEAVNWIITDFAAHWMPDLSQECKVKLMYFSVYSATSLCFWGTPELFLGEGQGEEIPGPERWTVAPEPGNVFPPSVALRSYEAAKWNKGLFSKNASGVTDAVRLGKMILGCDAVGVRSCSEFEGEYIDLYQRLLHKPVVPVGLLSPSKTEVKITERTTWDEVFNWLDQQKPRSVVYVGFGSEYKLTKTEVYEIAYGLELAELPFIWALRRPTRAADESGVLPPHFKTRTSGKGIVYLGWAPQLKILGHPSIGGSLFHSGWGSIIETLQHEHNLVLLPFIIDQGLNARAMVEKGLGVEVERREDGSYIGRDVADALTRAMIGDEAQQIRARVRQVAAVFGDQKLHEEHYVSQFVEFLTSCGNH